MEKEVVSKLGELVENCGHISKLLITNELAMAEGNIQLAQKSTIEALELLKVILNDVFIEVKEVLNTDNSDIEEASTSALELAKALSDIQYNAGVLLTLIADEQSDLICSSVKTKIVNAQALKQKLLKALTLQLN